MRKLLKFLFVIQEKNGQRRINPYNPLTYITITFTILIGLLLFGIIGTWEEIKGTNPFKWN